MIKKRFALFMTAAAVLFMSHTVNADFANEIKLVSGTIMNGRVGYSVSVDGDLAVAGVNGNTGSVKTLKRDTFGNWSVLGNLSGSSSHWAGMDVAISGNTAIVGASRGDDQGTDSGYATVYVLDDVTDIWTLQQKLLPHDGSAGAWFGYSVDISGDTAIVGAYGANAVYMFERDNEGTWTETGSPVWMGKLVASDAAASDNFGFSVAIDGDKVIIGARLDNSFGTGNVNGPGSAYFFRRNFGFWHQYDKLIASDRAGSDNFGYAVDISGNNAVIGTYGSNSAYLFSNDGISDDWTEEQILSASDQVGVDINYGRSVSISGDIAVAGAEEDNISGLTNAGSVYAYVHDGSGNWIEQAKIIASAGASYTNFGFAVSVSGDTLVVGAPKEINTYSNTGGVYAYTSTGTTVNTPPNVDSTDPINGAVGVGIGVVVTATFNEVMDVITIDGTSFMLSNGGSVAGLVSYDAGAMTATFTPSANLAYDTTYTATVTTDVTDSAGLNMAAPKVWTFTTGPEPDNTPPDVTTTNPDFDAVDVAINTVITATFDEAMNALTIDEITFTLSNGGPITGSVSYDAGTMTATFVPDTDLSNLTTYTAMVTTGVEDSAGNNMELDYSWDFTTITADVDSDGDGVPDNIDDTPYDASTASPQSATGTGKITVDTSANDGTVLAEVKSMSDLDPRLNNTNKPSNIEFPDGIVSFKVTGLTPGGLAFVTITFPTTFPAGAEYYKVDADGFYVFTEASIFGNTVFLPLIDDGSREGGDSNGTGFDGVIDDPGGVGVPVAATGYNQYDIDENNEIGDFELLDAIDDWASGLLGDFDLLDLIDFWAVGCYHWDAATASYEAGC